MKQIKKQINTWKNWQIVDFIYNLVVINCADETMGRFTIYWLRCIYVKVLAVRP